MPSIRRFGFLVPVAAAYLLRVSLAEAQATGPEFRVNGYTTGNQMGPRVAADSAGNFVVVWQSPDGSADGVFGRRYDSTGAPLGAEFLVNTYTMGHQGGPSVASDSGGKLVIVWQSYQDGSYDGVFGQRYSSAGAPLGAEFRANTFTMNRQRYPSVASDSEGDFVVVWQSYEQISAFDAVFGQRYNSAGAPIGTEFLVNTHTTTEAGRPSVASDSWGNFVVVWQGYGVFGQRYLSTGVPLGAEFRVNHDTMGFFPSVASDSNGNFVVVWQSYGQDGSGHGVSGRRYSSTGAPLGTEFQINTLTTNDQRIPSVASDSGGNFVVVWQSVAQDGSDVGVFGQRFDSAGTLLGAELRVNAYTTGYQGTASVVSGPAGDFTVVWQSDAEDGSQSGVFGQRFCPALEAVSISVVGAMAVCTTSTGGTATVTDVGGGVTSHQWAYRTASLGAATPIPGEIGSTYLIDGGSFGGAGTYYLVCATFPECGTFAFSNEIVVTVTEGGPTTATAGGPQAICPLGTTAPLGGNVPSVGTGGWSIVTGGVSGNFLPDATAPAATFEHTAGGIGGTATLRWTISSASCSSSADVAVTIQPAVATAGGPQTICALGTTAPLGGNTPIRTATGAWSIVTSGASGTFSPSQTEPDATFTHSGGTGIVTLRWTVSMASCAPAVADVLLTIAPRPTVATAGGPQTICAMGTTAGLGGNTPTSGTGLWTIVGGGGTGSFGPDASAPDATFTHTGGAGPVTTRWTISSGPCAASTADVLIGISPALTSVTLTVSGTMTVCANATGGTVSVTDTGGGLRSHQWGYRTLSKGSTTTIVGETGPSYLIDGRDFPATPGFYYLACLTSPECGSPIYSNEIVVVVLDADMSAPSVTAPPALTTTQTLCQ